MTRLIPKRGFALAQWLEVSWVEDARWVVLHYWKRILLLTLLGLGASFVYLHFNPDTYVSRAEVRFIPPQLANRYVVPNVAMQVDQRVHALAQLVGSRLTATKIIERFGLYPERRRFLPVADLVVKFQEDLHIQRMVSESGDSQKTVPTLVISFRYSQPELAQKVVQRIVELVYEENRRYRGDQSLGTTEFLQQQVRTVLEQLGEVEERLAGLEDPNENDHNYRGVIKTGQLHDLSRRHTDLQHQLNLSIVDRDLKRSLLGALEAQMEALGQRRESETPAATWALETHRSQVATIRARAEEMKMRYAPGFPERTLAENALKAAEEGLKSLERNESRAQMDNRREDMQNQISRVRAEWRAYELTVKRLEKDERELAAQVVSLRTRYLPDSNSEMDRIVIQREYSMLKDHYAELLKKQRESQIASDMERRGQGETVELIEPASAPSLPEMPNWPIKLSIGAFLGLVLGYSWALDSYLRHPRIRTADHIALLGNFPVLAEMPRGVPLLASARKGKALQRVATTLTLLLLLSGCQKDTPQSLTRRAEVSLKQGDTATAILLLRKAIQLDARYPEAHYQLGLLLLKEGAAAVARESLIRAAEAWPTRQDLQVRLGDLSYELYFSDPGRPGALLREVEETALRLVQRWPGNPAGHRLLAQVMIERSQPAEAVALMEKALGQLTDNTSDGAAALKSQLASTLYQTGHAAEGETQLRELIATHPKYTPGYDLLYLQLMDRRQLAAARAVLEQKYTHLHSVAFGLQLAAHDYANGEHQRASQETETLATEHAQTPLAFSDLGDFWVHRADVERARKFYEMGLAQDAKNRTVYAGRIAELLAAKQGPAVARQYLSRELARSPNDPLLLAYSSAMDLDAPANSERNQARVRLESILSKMPNSPFVRFHLGRAYLQAGELEKAGQHFEKCVMLDPNYAPGWVALAEADLMSGRVGLAQNRLRAVLQRSPTFTPALLMQAKTNLAGDKAGEAEASLERVIAQDPTNVEAWLTLARAQISQKKLAEARKSAASAAAAARSTQPGEFRPALLSAELDAAQGDIAGALKAMDRAAREWPDQPAVAEAQANLTLRHGEPEAARGLYAKLLVQSPHNDTYRLGLAGALALLGKQTEAAAEFERLQKSKPDDPRPWLLHGALLSAKGRLPEAQHAYEEALKRDRNHPLVLNNLAFVIARSRKDLASALQYAEQAKRILPSSREVNDTLAYVYVAMGMDRNAIAVLEEMSAARPQDLKIARLLAQVRQGNRPAALRQFEEN
ncbi:MAG: tetratricopeptide repeat protein [Bryobacteraceae bacterium]|nr:tetratricopeptide repeat protein [Bryobacteraceae bacterium]